MAVQGFDQWENALSHWLRPCTVINKKRKKQKNKQKKQAQVLILIEQGISVLRNDIKCKLYLMMFPKNN